MSSSLIFFSHERVSKHYPRAEAKFVGGSLIKKVDDIVEEVRNIRVVKNYGFLKQMKSVRAFEFLRTLCIPDHSLTSLIKT